METIVTRTEVSKVYNFCRKMLKTEKHHKHQIIKDARGNYRWKPNPAVEKLFAKKLDIGVVIELFDHLGCNRNSEIVRKMYRDKGYSLFGYWEIFYWEMNNDIADEYVPNSQ